MADTPPPHDPGVSLAVMYLRSDRIVARRVADEFLLVPLVGRGANLDSVYSLNKVGTFIWERLDGRTTGDDIVLALCSTFEVGRPEAEEDFRDFVSTLLQIRAAGPVGGGSG
jgi:hypothetical protein